MFGDSSDCVTSSSGFNVIADGIDTDSPDSIPFGSVARPVIPAGCCVIHHQNVLHGSSGNRSTTRHRRALVVHLIDGGVEFVDDPTYIYGRYKLAGSRELRDEFFPVTWRRN